MERIQVYLPENPARLIELALNVTGRFGDNFEDIETDYIAITGIDGDVPRRLSLAGAILYEEYETLSMCQKASGSDGILVQGLINENEYYNSHVNFINGFVKFNIDAIMAYVNPRCVMRVEDLPPYIDMDAPNNSEGIAVVWLNHDELDESIRKYVEWRVLDGEYYEGDEQEVTLDIVTNRLIKFERLLKEFFVYVPVS